MYYSILVLFCFYSFCLFASFCQIIVKLIAFRLKFFTHKFEVSFVLITKEVLYQKIFIFVCMQVFDAIVVLESFILDIASL